MYEAVLLMIQINMDVEVPLGPEEVAKLLGSLKTSVDASSTSLGPLMQKYADFPLGHGSAC